MPGLSLRPQPGEEHNLASPPRAPALTAAAAALEALPVEDRRFRRWLLWRLDLELTEALEDVAEVALPLPIACPHAVQNSALGFSGLKHLGHATASAPPGVTAAPAAAAAPCFTRRRDVEEERPERERLLDRLLARPVEER